MQLNRLAFLALAVLVLASMPGAIAGTASEPEVTDAGKDVTGPGGAPACGGGQCAPPASFADLLTGWIALEGDNVVFRIDSANNANAYGPADYVFHFTIAGIEYAAGLHAEAANSAGGLPGSGAVTPTGVATEAAWIDTVITITVPLAAIGNPAGGAVITNTFLTSLVNAAAQGPMTDRAPDSGFGADFVFPMLEITAPATVYLNVTEGPLSHSHVSNMTADSSYLINWTGPASITLDLALTGTGSANITLVDANGTEAFTCICEAPDNQTVKLVAAPGVWQLYVNYTAFNGTSSVTLAETIDVVTGVDPSTPAPGDGMEDNGTDDNTPEGNGTAPEVKDTPAVAVGLILMAFVAIAVRRRK